MYVRKEKVKKGKQNNERNDMMDRGQKMAEIRTLLHEGLG